MSAERLTDGLVAFLATGTGWEETMLAREVQESRVRIAELEAKLAEIAALPDEHDATTDLARKEHCE